MNSTVKLHPKFYTVTFDNNRQKYMWANDEEHVHTKCLEEYPGAKITNIFLNNREPVRY